MGEMELTQSDIDALLSSAGALQPEPGPSDPEPEPEPEDEQPAETEFAPREPAFSRPSALQQPDLEAFSPPQQDEDAIGPDRRTLEALMDIPLDVTLEIGRTTLRVEEILALANGSVVELDKLAGDPVDILINDEPVARGEIVVLNDNFCVRITEILEAEARLNALR